ncbi:hypothetical protein LCGC14_1620560, partial [marine sediment metagenome]
LISYEDYIEAKDTPYISALFLSHAHLDHLRNIMFIKRDILHKSTKLIFMLYLLKEELIV